MYAEPNLLSYGADDEDRTHDLFITNEVHYRCATSAFSFTLDEATT